MHPLDRPLLLGLIALEREFVSSAELIDAFRAWRSKPDESLGQILAARGKLSADKIESLEHYLADSSLGAAPTATLRPDSTPRFGVVDPTSPLLCSPSDSRPPKDATALPETSTRFKPVKLHAQGGLGQVFLAEDCELHRRVALKEIQPDAADDPVSRRRFVAEAEITGNLEHPGIVPVYGLGVHADGRPFYAMRFIQGETLSAAIKKFHQPGPGDFASLDFRNLLTRLIGVCNAVAFAHSRNVVHRDLKPSNVMLGPFGETLVVDWGLAKQIVAQDDETLAPRGRTVGSSDLATSAGEVIGTPAFMSPEQASGKVHQVGRASDIYSLGAILHFLLTAQAPFRATSADSVDPAAPPEPPSNRPHVARAPRALAAICSQAMAENPHDRYSSALDLAADIERWLADERTIAYAEPWVDTAFRWMRKNRLPVAVATALLLATSIALAIGYAFVSKERDIAEIERKKAVAANSRAQENAAATRQVIEQFLIQIGDDRWSEIPAFEDVRLQMVSLAVERYRILLFQQPDDAALAADSAMAFRRCANLYRMTGRYEPASKLYEEALGGLRKVAAAEPQTDRYERLLCETMCDRATLIFRERGPVAAEAPLRDALDVGRRLREKQPNSTAAHQAEARVQGDLADVLCELERYDEAIGLARSATTVLQRAADANPGTMVNRVTAAFSSVSFGQILRLAGRWDEASTALENAARRASDYAASHPSDVNLQYSLAFANLERAIVREHREGPTDAAAKEFTDAIAVLEKLAQQFPGTSSFRRKLAEALTIQADLQRSRSEIAPAAESAKRAIELLTQLDQKSGTPAVYQSFLASAHRAAAEIELARNDPAAAKPQLQQASDRIARARAVNPSSQSLSDQARHIQTQLESIP